MFVADEIPRELARIVEFLNDQMRADVRAVELRWFSDTDGRVSLSPRVIGETERAAIAKGPRASLPRLSRDEWVAKHIAPVGKSALAGAQAYIELVENAGGLAGVASQQGSIYASFTSANGKPFYPFHLWSQGALVSLSLRWLKNLPTLQSEGARQEWLDRLSATVGPLTTSNLGGFPSFKVEVLADPRLAKQVGSYLSDLVAYVQQ